jgi:UDP-N-acetylglucosamine diphosphorylase / glucose-1-phosphate thymidylyltransferase / UDP-N-acetylgalactosamine diphosphorylase / glucosamine-1-phosphate N-acetyltransferase / galactosamine-1-phosphate N-acetyltransferase
MKLVLFEDETTHRFLPLVYTRPMFTLRCGAFTLQERLESLLAQWTGSQQQLTDQAETAQGLCRWPVADLHTISMWGLCRSYMRDYYCPQSSVERLLSESDPLLLINGRALDLEWLPALLNAPIGTVFECDGVLVGAYLSTALASTILYYLSEQASRIALEELQRFTRVQSVETTLLRFPWDLITHAGEQIIRDVPLLAHRLPRYTTNEPLVTLRGDGHIYVAPTAQLDGPIVLDSSDGPIIIDDDAHIEPFSFIQGPAYIGKKTLISSARIRGESSIGPVCRIGGEVEASIIQSFSNKHHDGFLGHSWLGEWVNLGAMTTNSDLKNTYGSVKMDIDGMGYVDSGVLKLGAFLADHVKLGIGLHMTGGAVIGTASNIFGIHMAPKTIPPFIWGSEVFREYRIDSMVDVAGKVMGRRKQTMVPAYEAMLRAVFAMTRDSRGTLHDALEPAVPVTLGQPVRTKQRSPQQQKTLAS